MSTWGEREDALGWFGVTVNVLQGEVVEGRDNDVHIPVAVKLDGSGLSLRTSIGAEFRVLAERDNCEGETRRRALEEARALASLFLQLTSPMPGKE